ncbi:hypothetical protein [Fluviispira vulneris]|uniref:hypothetical protein n=1 Tax=Fluviispira vulneris TaxID=2763012 RepID=UPI0016456354|nr:hypothetical protein [Fluviispira vulneris]
MKLSTSSTFDVATVANTRTYQEAKTFFDFMNKFVSEVVEGFSKKLTLGDNFNYSERELSVTHATPMNLGNTPYTTVFIRSRQTILSHKIEQNNKADTVLTVYFKSPHAVAAKSAIWSSGNTVKYEVLNANLYTAGDGVTFEGFSNSANNGTFVVAAVNQNANILYVVNPFRTDAKQDEQRTEYLSKPPQPQKITLGILN